MKPPVDTEYRKLTLTRPLTDGYIGDGTMARRSRDAERSRLMDGHERERVERVTVKSPWTGRLYVVAKRS